MNEKTIKRVVIKIGYNDFIMPYEDGLTIFGALQQAELKKGYGEASTIVDNDVTCELSLITTAQYALYKANTALTPEEDK